MDGHAFPRMLHHRQGSLADHTTWYSRYRPSSKTLEKHTVKTVRRIIGAKDGGFVSHGVSAILQQLIMLRLGLGFQFCPERHSDAVLMSRGNVYHELSCTSDAEVQIVEYLPVSQSIEWQSSGRRSTLTYGPSVIQGVPQDSPHTDVTLTAAASPPNLSLLDDRAVMRQYADATQLQNRMRFVLIPVEPPRLGPGSLSSLRELSDEEKWIDGIQRLTQLWQKHRYYTVTDQRHHASLTRTIASPAVGARDPNPLAIEYQTRDPSAVVNAYGPTLSGELSGNELAAPLFAESEMFHSSTFDVAKLVKHIQEPPPQGVEVKDRRWFTRFHLKCFRGDEMVNWTLRVFKDLHTRDAAVAIGNELMKRGVFTHVRHKHDFRDGNYFYQITSAHRTTDYPDTASMFGRSNLRSVPATPASETFTPKLRPVYSGSDSSSKGTPIIAPAERRELLLSQVMLYNVDLNKRPDQAEVVSLHYDRIHNPENCYHIQLEWTNTTAKLIRDAIARWTALADGHGLRLVQVPLAEACRLKKQHPFDLPIPVKLAVRPPEKTFATPQLDPWTSAPRLADDPLAYQKAILRKMDFVLDLEAAASFTSKLDIKYSWGPPEYELTQFVHKSGLVLAEISGGDEGDFLLLPNRLGFQRPSTSTKQATHGDVEDIMRKFVRFCLDEGAVRACYEEASKPRMPAPSPWTSPETAVSDLDIPPMQLPPHLTHRVALRGL